MRTLKQFEPLVVDELEQSKYNLPNHQHNYFEIVYISQGCGIHFLNNNKLPYKAGDLFFIAPEDQHYFEIRKRSRFVFIKFTDSYFSAQNYLSADKHLIREPTALMRQKLLKEKTLVMSEPCITILRNTIDNIVAYNCRPDISTSWIVFHQIMSILCLAKEALMKLDNRFAGAYPNQEQLITYIHEHIYYPETVQIKNIALYFNISPTYFSAYFKRSFGVSYRDYLNNYRAALIEKRIASRQFTLRQIADEFGFTDESHLSHFFKNQRNVSPRQYQESLTQAYLRMKEALDTSDNT